MIFFDSAKILNDPVYGFIPIPAERYYDIVHHPYFQRLRRIKQLGTTDMVYPGATHTRFSHTMGSFYLTNLALTVLATKGVSISKDDAWGVLSAILLHDIGHGPFSHALEGSIIPNINHEKISKAYMKYFDKIWGGFSPTIDVFSNKYKRPFLHELVSSQLDTDRLDYLKRDSFFTGVSEGVISTDRIIQMLNVIDNKLVVDIKGLYSVEKFLIARRLMYWQVYLHKTVVSSEMMLRSIIKRARYLVMKNEELTCITQLKYFLSNENFELNDTLLQNFSSLDDNDIISSIKIWQNHNDKVLSTLCKLFINRQLFTIRLKRDKFSETQIDEKINAISKRLKISKEDARYFVISSTLSNNAYEPTNDKILILTKDKSIKDLTQVSDMFDHDQLSTSIKKYFLCYHRELG